MGGFSPLRSDFRNTLIGLDRHQDMSFADVRIILAEAEQWMAGREFSVVSQSVIQLAKESTCSAYDWEFVREGFVS